MESYKAIPRESKNMFMKMCANYCLTASIICFAVSCTVATKIDTRISKIALEFGYKWLGSPKLHVSIMMPNKHTFKVREAVKLAKKINSERGQKNIYYVADFNVTKYNTMLHTHNELIWYPFNIENYNMDCLFLESS